MELSDKKVYPYSDLFARYLLGDESNSDILLSFINAVHEDYDFPSISSISIKNPFNLKSLKDERESIIDVKAQDESGRQYDIEVQISGNELFKHRSLYYWAKLYSGQLKSGYDFNILKPTICINLINFNILKELDRVHTCFVPREVKNPELILTDHLIIHYLELPKFSKQVGFDTQLDKWLAYFKYEGQEESIMETIIKDDPILQKAHDRYTQFTQNDELMEMYEARMKWQLQYNTDVKYAEEKGIKKGFKDGVLDTAKNMLENDIDVKTISKCTGLSIDEINRLVN